VPDSWNPPTGPPNGVPVHPADAKRGLEDAVAAATAHDQTLRARVAALAAARVEAGVRLEAATAEIEDARALAKRALVGANEAARAGQRADAARLTGAAQVFAMRLRDARAAVAEWEAVVAAESAQRQELDAALGENVGRLQAVAAARLPMLGGRKAARSQAMVDETVAALSAPVTEIVAQAEADARAALAAADEAARAADAVEVTVDDLEREVDYGGTDEILDELRVELGLPTADSAPEDDAAAPAPEAGAGHPDAGTDDASPPQTPPVPHASGARF
jgi:hypothetical protein